MSGCMIIEPLLHQYPHSFDVAVTVDEKAAGDYLLSLA